MAFQQGNEQDQQHNACPFRVERMIVSDFSLMLRPSQREGGDLAAAPIAPLCWPVQADDDAGALQRLEYSVFQCRRYFESDPTVHCIKAVKPDDGEIVSTARWHFYPRGYEFARDHVIDAGEGVPDGALQVYNLDLYRGMFGYMMEQRAQWVEKDKPCWALMAMNTRAKYRKQGAASLLINWGVAMAKKDRVPAILEASAHGKPVYESCGFRQVGDLVEWDCRPYGVDVTFNMAKMAWYPEEQGV